MTLTAYTLGAFIWIDMVVKLTLSPAVSFKSNVNTISFHAKLNNENKSGGLEDNKWSCPAFACVTGKSRCMHSVVHVMDLAK